MKRISGFLLIVAAVLFSWSIAQANCHFDKLVGLWATQFGSYYYYKPDGSFSFINYKSKTGYSWQAVSNVLPGEDTHICPILEEEEDYSRKDGEKILLRFSYVPSTGIIEKEYTIIVRDNVLFSFDGENTVTFERSFDPIETFEGEIYFDEETKLPPLVEIRYSLYKNNEEFPFAMYSVPAEGKNSYAFSFDCVVDNTDDIYLEAVIYHENTPLLATQKLVDIREKKIFLTEAGQNYHMKKVDVPSKYVAPNGDIIFFEDHGLAFVEHDDETVIAHWALVDRNHTIEIARTNAPPYVATLQDSNTIVFRYFEGMDDVYFNKAEGECFEIEKVHVSGKLLENSQRLYFIDCTSHNYFPVQYKEKVKQDLQKAYFDTVEPVNIEAIFRRNEQGGIDLYPMKISKDLANKCQLMYQHTSVEDTYWRLIELNDKPVHIYYGQSEPHIIIRDNMLSGSDGCNNFFMDLDIKDNRITLTEGGATLMFCIEGGDQAREIHWALNHVNTWQIKGSLLKLLQDDKVLAVFEAVYL